jgi:hypothetical protein
MTWHADTDLLDRYAEGRIDDAGAYSLEAHLLACERCRSALAGAADHEQMHRMWAEIEDALDTPRIGIVEAGLVRLGVREHLARLLAATTALRLSWLAAEVLALGVAVLAANTAVTARGRELGLFTFLALAAVLPVAGVATAYGPGFDPTHEIGLASPMRSFRLLMIRSTAVLGTSTLLAALAALALPGLDWRAAAWTIPSVALVLGTLALATRLSALWSAGIVSFSWLAIAVLIAFHRSDPFVIFRADAQIVFVVVIVVSAFVVAGRRGSFEQGVNG